MQTTEYRNLTVDEQHALFRNCAEDGDPTAFRDGVVLALGFGAGLLPREIRAAEVADWIPEQRKLIVRQS